MSGITLFQIKNKYQQKKLFTVLTASSLILLLITACAEMDSHSSISRFQKSEDVYRASMRWGEWTNLFQLMKDKPDSNAESAKLTPPSEAYLTHLDSIKVKHIEVVSSGMNDKKGTGESRFKIEYRFDHSAKIKLIRQTVSWWYDKKNNLWFTNTPLPEEFDLPKSRTIRLSPKDK